MRCFVAVWPDQATRVALAALSGDLRQHVEHRRAARIDDLHLTLAFIASLPEDAAVPVAEALARLRFDPFDWRIDTLGFFSEAGVVWAGSEPASNKSLAALARQSRGILDRMSIEYDPKPLSPHVTLFRGVRQFETRRIGVPINWRIDSLALYRSAGGRAGSNYTRVLS